MLPTKYDAVVIGGGFYGCNIALYLRQHGFKKILLLEQGNALLAQASYNNQARVHGGYHYPRSYTTAIRSQVNARIFKEQYEKAIENRYTKLYGIAKYNSKVTAAHFVKFCQHIDAPLRPAPAQLSHFFSQEYVKDLFLVEEVAFDASMLRELIIQKLTASAIEIGLNTKVLALKNTKMLQIETNTQVFEAAWVFNCTYSGLNQLQGDYHKTKTILKYELAELALLELPEELKQLSVTIIDGPFFSIIPFAPEQCHVLSHVRYTPHCSWTDAEPINPYQKLIDYPKHSRYQHMLRDAQRFMPLLANSRYKKSLFEVKTVLLDNEHDDGRPILLETNQHLPQCISILGGKIDNIYDVLASLSNVIP